MTTALERRTRPTRLLDWFNMNEMFEFPDLFRVPKGVGGKDIAAAYKDGILTVTVPMPKLVGAEVQKVSVSRG